METQISNDSNGASVHPEIHKLKSRLFHLERYEDVHEMSGVGVVAEGIEFSDGTCIIKWLSKFSSIAIYPSILHVGHIHGHEGKTKVVYDT